MRIQLKRSLFVPLLALALGLPMAPASDSAGVATPWSAPTLHRSLAAMPPADATRGGELHQGLFCASCHGEKGESVSHNWPNLAGQRASYTYKMLLDYASGLRREDGRADPMVVIARMLSEQDMADLAAFYAVQTPPVSTAGKAVPDPAALLLVRKGDPVRLITPCASCHGLSGQGGRNETPALAGQTERYFLRSMRAFRDGSRANDVHEGMGQFARDLSDDELRALATYFAR